MNLRPYQQEDVGRIRQAVLRSGSVVYACPTGAGKTVIASEIARLAADKGSKTLFLVHRRELVKQAVGTLYEALPGTQIGVEAAGWPSTPWLNLQVGMVQSIARRDYLKNLKPDIVIVDEAHHARAATWEKVMKMWPQAKRIGLTATPERLDGKGLGEHFAEMVMGPTIKELVGQGYLAPTRVLRIPSSFILEGVRRDKSGEYRQSDVAERITDTVIADACEAYIRYANGKRAIFFGVHRDHSRRVCESLRARGVRAEHVDGDDPPVRRDRIMNALRTGGLDVVGNVDIISEGFDAPACEVILMGSPTRSVTRYLQQAGRAMRPGEGKTALVLDLAGNSHELGLPDDVREWTLEDGEVTGAKKTHATPRECPRCLTVFWGRICPQCLHSEPLAEVQEVETELEEALVGAPVQKKGRRSALNTELAKIHRMAAQERSKAVIELANDMGYKPGWARHILRAWGMAE